MNNEKIFQEIESLKQKNVELEKLILKISAIKKSRLKTMLSSIPRKGLIAIIAISVLSVSAIIYATSITTLNTFTVGSTIVAEDVNANFQYLNERISPVGSISMHGSDTAPTGWLLCDGSEVSRTTYAQLYAAIGTKFGVGDGATTFKLPDFRGIFPKGAGTTARIEGKDASGNFYTGTLGIYSTDKMQGHKHDNSLSDPGHSHSDASSTVHYIGGSAGNAGTAWVNNDIFIGSVATTSSTAGITITNGSLISDSTNGTPRTGTTTEPQSLGVNFIIKY